MMISKRPARARTTEPVWNHTNMKMKAKEKSARIASVIIVATHSCARRELMRIEMILSPEGAPT